MYYTKNAKDTHPELMENALGCYPRQTATIQKEVFTQLSKIPLVLMKIRQIKSLWKYRII
jgi:hypothetical protein